MGASISSSLNSMRPANSTTNTSGAMMTTASMNSPNGSQRRNRRFGFGSPSMTGGKSRKQRKGSRKSRKTTTRRRR